MNDAKYANNKEMAKENVSPQRMVYILLCMQGCSRLENDRVEKFSVTLVHSYFQGELSPHTILTCNGKLFCKVNLFLGGVFFHILDFFQNNT